MTTITLSAVESGNDVVRSALRDAVARLDDTIRPIAAYHLGWCDEHGTPVVANGGKSIRSWLTLLAARAAGGSEFCAVPGAVAVELVHNFSLVHDDLMDGDVERRHHPTVWAVHGAAAAILCGDAMLALATQVLLDVGTLDAVEAARRLAGATQKLIRGQHADLQFEQRRYVGVEECLDMAAGKTGALLSCSAAIGAVLAGAPPTSVRALSTYGAELGLAFQLVDDLLGIWGDAATTGKPVGSDLRARKKSLPVAFALTDSGPASAALARWLATEGPDGDDDIARAAELVELAGGRAWAAEEATRRLALAESALAQAALDTDAVDELVALGRFVVTREN